MFAQASWSTTSTLSSVDTQHSSQLKIYAKFLQRSSSFSFHYCHYSHVNVICPKIILSLEIHLSICHACKNQETNTALAARIKVCAIVTAANYLICLFQFSIRGNSTS